MRPLPLTFRRLAMHMLCAHNNWAVLQGTTSCAQEAKRGPCMNKTAIRLVAVAAVAGLGIAGCSSSKKSTPSASRRLPPPPVDPSGAASTPAPLRRPRRPPLPLRTRSAVSSARRGRRRSSGRRHPARHPVVLALGDSRTRRTSRRHSMQLASRSTSRTRSVTRPSSSRSVRA